MNDGQIVPQAGSVMFDKDVLEVAKQAQILMINGYANAIAAATMKRAMKGQMPANNFNFKFNDVRNMGIDAAGTYGMNNQQLTLATQPVQQVNQLLPQQPVVVDNTPPPWAEQLIKDVAELKGARGQ